MKQLVIIGTGGLAREVYDFLPETLGYGIEWQLKGFLEGDMPQKKTAYELLYAPLLGDIYTYEIEENDVFVCAIANPQVKMRLTQYIEEKGGQFINIIDRSARVSLHARLGEGIILYGGTGISCDALIGDHVLINAYSSIGHDAEVGAYSTIFSYVNITGYVKIGERTIWGSGSRVLPKARIESDSVVGTGSVVLKRVKAGQTVFGIPAMPIFEAN